MSEPSPQPGQRRPNEKDLTPLLEMIWNGASLRAACLKLELHVPSTSDWLHSDDGRREQYARAREGRAEFIAEDAMAVNRAAALGISIDNRKVDASGARGYLEAAKWQAARMAPKTAPVQRHEHTFSTLSDEEIEREIAARQGSQATSEEE